MPSYAASAPIAQHRGGDAQLAGDLHQWPTAACQQGDRLRLELIRKTTPFLAHSTPSRSLRSLAKVSTNSGEAQNRPAGSSQSSPLSASQNRLPSPSWKPLWTRCPRGPDWMPITPKTGYLFHADSQTTGQIAPKGIR